VSAVLGELDERCPELAVRSLLDLGAGPGVGAWAALARFEAIASLTLVEQDRAAIALGREIAAAAGLAEGRAWTWQPQDLRGRSTLAPHDLVLMSYALGELDADARRRAVEAAWQATTGALVIIEPGTPRHFAGLLDARTQLIALGAVIVAPCPHARECPMGPAPSPSPSPSASPSSSESPSLSTVGGAPTDWCHFAVRLPRTRRHRLLKAGSLSYEDEKFSYVIAVPASSLRPSDHAAVTRIVRHPIYSKGRVELALCTADGLATRMVTHAARDDYRRARKVAWGDAWPA
jgi:ribosomal protein RSM22 (predicted rRNA methylase)